MTPTVHVDKLIESTFSVVHRQGRPTAEDYNEAIQALRDASHQLEPDGLGCQVCGDSGHQAWECHHNPLVMARRASRANAHEGTAIPWRCFHCGQMFDNVTDARDHFGERDELVKCIATTHPLVVSLRTKLTAALARIEELCASK